MAAGFGLLYAPEQRRGGRGTRPNRLADPFLPGSRALRRRSGVLVEQRFRTGASSWLIAARGERVLAGDEVHTT